MLITSNIPSSINYLPVCLSSGLPNQNPFDLINHNNSETVFIQSINNKTANSAGIAYSKGTAYKTEFRGIIYQTKKLCRLSIDPLMRKNPYIMFVIMNPEPLSLNGE